MIALTPHMRVLLARDPVDFRRGIDGLARICKDSLASDPFSGAVFAFRNRTNTALKLLVYDGQGFWLCHKRLSTGRFQHWPKGDEPASKLLAQEVQVLLSGGNPKGAQFANSWRKIAN